VHGPAGASDHRAGRGTRHEQAADQQRQDSGDRDPRRADREREAPAEERPEVPALVLAERDHQADGEHDEARAKRPDVDEVAARDHQRPHDHERGRQAERGAPDRRVEPVADPAADVAAVPAGPYHEPHEDAQRGESKPDQLRMLVPVGLGLLGCALASLDARGHARLEGASFPAARHARLLRRAAPDPLPLAALLDFLRLPPLLAVHRLGDRALVAGCI
jgi:hypothetical protein